jgi:selenocysteine lyase/cysteine desulfurase
VNSVLRSLPLLKGDVILYLSTAYTMVKNTAAFLANERGVTLLEVKVPIPVTSVEDFLKPVEKAIKGMGSGERLKLAIFSHVSSTPSFIEPIVALSSVVKSLSPKCKVLVDGAHVLGQLPLNLNSLGEHVDYYVSNCHKWMYAPKGSAFLWCKDTSGVQPTVISSRNKVDPPGSGVGEVPDFGSRYAYTGTKDFTAYLAVSDALAFRSELEGSRGMSVIEYNTGLGRWAGDYLVGLWGTRRLCPREMEAFMINVELPTTDIEEAARMRVKMLEEEGVYMLVLRDEGSGIVYTRLSMQVYLEREDFVRVGELVLKFLRHNEQPATAV